MRYTCHRCVWYSTQSVRTIRILFLWGTWASKRILQLLGLWHWKSEGSDLLKFSAKYYNRQAEVVEVMRFCNRSSRLIRKPSGYCSRTPSDQQKRLTYKLVRRGCYSFWLPSDLMCCNLYDIHIPTALHQCSLLYSFTGIYLSVQSWLQKRVPYHKGTGRRMMVIILWFYIGSAHFIFPTGNLWSLLLLWPWIPALFVSRACQGTSCLISSLPLQYNDHRRAAEPFDMRPFLLFYCQLFKMPMESFLSSFTDYLPYRLSLKSNNNMSCTYETPACVLTGIPQRTFSFLNGNCKLRQKLVKFLPVSTHAQ